LTQSWFKTTQQFLECSCWINPQNGEVDGLACKCVAVSITGQYPGFHYQSMFFSFRDKLVLSCSHILLVNQTTEDQGLKSVISQRSETGTQTVGFHSSTGIIFMYS